MIIVIIVDMEVKLIVRVMKGGMVFMIENKRFTINGVGISDHEQKRLYDLKTIDGFISVRDLLNAQHETIRQVREVLRETYADCEKMGLDECCDVIERIAKRLEIELFE